MNNNKNKLMSIFLFSMMMLFTGMAFAADPTALDLTVSDEDQSFKLLQYVFGLEDASGALGDASPVGEVFAVLNAIVLMVGGIILAYTMIIGTLNTAHDGEMLGKKWSSTMIPVRTALGVAAVFPMSSGFSMIQGLVLWFVMQGVGAANLIWNVYTDNAMGAPAYFAQALPNTNGIAAQMFMNSVCQKSLALDNGDFSSASGTNPNEYRVVNDSVNPTANTAGKIIYKYEEKSGLMSTFRNACGTVEIAFPKLPKTESSFIFFKTTDGISAQQAASNAYYAEVFNISKTKFNTLQAKMDVAATSFVNKIREENGTQANPSGSKQDIAGTTTVNTDIVNFVKEYETELKSKAKEFFDSHIEESNLKEEIAADGWLFAGAYFMKMINLQQSAQSALDMQYSTEAGADSAMASDFYKTNREIAIKYISGTLGSNGTVSADSKLAQMQTSAAGKASSENDFGAGAKISQWLLEAIALNDTFTPPTTMNENAVLSIANQGHTMIVEATTGWIGLSVISAGLNASSIIQVAGTPTPAAFWAKAGLGAYESMTPVLSVIIIGLLGLGLMLAVYIPFLPYVIWMGAIFGWLVLVVEAVIAAPLWAIIHIHPHGDDFAGKGAPGYNLLLSLVIRPTLMVLGLIFAMVLINPVVNILRQTFYFVFNQVATGHWAGLIVTIGASVVYVSLLMMLFNKVFGLIHVIPDQVLRWNGFGGDGMIGSNAREGADKTTGVIMGVKQESGHSARASQSGVGQAGQRIRASKDNFASNQAAEQNSQRASLAAKIKADDDFVNNTARDLNSDVEPIRAGAQMALDKMAETDPKVAERTREASQSLKEAMKKDQRAAHDHLSVD